MDSETPLFYHNGVGENYLLLLVGTAGLVFAVLGDIRCSNNPDSVVKMWILTYPRTQRKSAITNEASGIGQDIRINVYNKKKRGCRLGQPLFPKM